MHKHNKTDAKIHLEESNMKLFIFKKMLHDLTNGWKSNMCIPSVLFSMYFLLLRLVTCCISSVFSLFSLTNWFKCFLFCYNFIFYFSHALKCAGIFYDFYFFWRNHRKTEKNYNMNSTAVVPRTPITNQSSTRFIVPSPFIYWNIRRR